MVTSEADGKTMGTISTVNLLQQTDAFRASPTNIHTTSGRKHLVYNSRPLSSDSRVPRVVPSHGNPPRVEPRPSLHTTRSFLIKQLQLQDERPRSRSENSRDLAAFGKPLSPGFGYFDEEAISVVLQENYPSSSDDNDTYGDAAENSGSCGSPAGDEQDYVFQKPIIHITHRVKRTDKKSVQFEEDLSLKSVSDTESDTQPRPNSSTPATQLKPNTYFSDKQQRSKTPLATTRLKLNTSMLNTKQITDTPLETTQLKTKTPLPTTQLRIDTSLAATHIKPKIPAFNTHSRPNTPISPAQLNSNTLLSDTHSRPCTPLSKTTLSQVQPESRDTSQNSNTALSDTHSRPHTPLDLSKSHSPLPETMERGRGQTLKLRTVLLSDVRRGGYSPGSEAFIIRGISAGKVEYKSEETYPLQTYTTPQSGSVQQRTAHAYTTPPGGSVQQRTTHAYTTPSGGRGQQVPAHASPSTEAPSSPVPSRKTSSVKPAQTKTHSKVMPSCENEDLKVQASTLVPSVFYKTDFDFRLSETGESVKEKETPENNNNSSSHSNGDHNLSTKMYRVVKHQKNKQTLSCTTPPSTPQALSPRHGPKLLIPNKSEQNSHATKPSRVTFKSREKSLMHLQTYVGLNQPKLHSGGHQALQTTEHNNSEYRYVQQSFLVLNLARSKYMKHMAKLVIFHNNRPTIGQQNNATQQF